MSTKGKSLREAFGDEMMLLGKENPDIYIVDADVGKSCKTLDFATKYPGQHVNVGIAEQVCADVAAGLATMGKIPFISTYAVFGSMRMVEQIRQEVCYPRLNVKIACSHGGLTPANDGASHQCIEDFGIMRTLPNMTVIMGADYYATRNLLRKVAAYDGPVYIRFTREAVPFVYDETIDLEIGKAHQIYDGKDIAIIANGDTVCYAKEAAEELQRKGHSVRLLDMHTLKPLDEQAVEAAIDDIGKIITVEDHNIINGLGSAVSDVVAQKGKGIVRKIGVQDHFGESAPYEHLLANNGISVKNIVSIAEKLIG